MEFLSGMLILWLVAFIASAEHVCYVKPSTSSSCPGQPCWTLDEYVKQQENYFTTGSTFQFMAGNHSIDSAVYLRDISNITFRTEFDNAVNIRSDSELVIFNCNNVANFVIQGITWSFFTGKNLSLLSFVNSKQILLKESAFHGNFRAVLSDHCTVTVENCLFEGNTGFYGGAIHAANGSNITLTGSTFCRNRALLGGGAIYVSESFLTFAVHGEGAMSLQDTAPSLNSLTIYSATRFGGAIASSYSGITMTSGTTHFMGNHAEEAGGAYFGNFSALNVDANTQQIFENNSAPYNSGGAVHCQYGSLNLAGTSQFMRNSVGFNRTIEAGGAIFTIGCNFTLSGRASFGYNYAPKGGAICASKSIVFCGGASIHLFNNWASQVGGGMALANSTVEIATEQITFAVKNNSRWRRSLHGVSVASKV